MVTETLPRRLSSSTRENFSESVVGDAFRTSLCGENVDPDESMVEDCCVCVFE